MTFDIYKSKEETKKEILAKYKPKAFAYNKDGIWFGIIINYCLYAYGRDSKQVFKRLSMQLNWYIDNAIENKEVKHFIPRRAPKELILKYYKIKFLLWLKRLPKEDYIIK